MAVTKLETTPGFIYFDLPDAPTAAGPVRSARKILQSSAADLARSLTYTFAAFEMQVGGASAGVNAEDAGRSTAVEAFVAEIEPMVASGHYLPDPAKGVTTANLEPLRSVDRRSALDGADHQGTLLRTWLRAAGSVTAAAGAVGGDLTGRTVAIEGFDAAGPALASQLVERGATVVAASSPKGSVTDGAGIPPDELGGRLAATDAPAWKVFAAGADVLFTGSKMGAVNHTTAENLTPAALVPTGPIPFTAKALAVLRRKGVAVLPDFLTTAGPIFADFAPEDATADSVAAVATDRIGSLTGELMGHDDGPTLAGCYHAESFLRTWRDQLPFGRPMAP